MKLLAIKFSVEISYAEATCRSVRKVSCHLLVSDRGEKHQHFAAIKSLSGDSYPIHTIIVNERKVEGKVKQLHRKEKSS